ncbi:MAG: hypothetical protein AABW68_03125 [archaeon]
MIEFTLSKINLLILVIALFSIISFFSLSVGKIFLVGEVKQELEKYSITLNGMAIAPTTCDSKPFAIPPKFTSFGNNIYYQLHISKTQSSEGNRLIFTVSDVRSPDTVLAAASLTTEADIAIYDLVQGQVVSLGELEDLVLDPQAVPPVNAFYVVKSVKSGLKTLHLFPCAITANSQTCFPTIPPDGSSIKEQVDDHIDGSQSEEYFLC